MSSSPPHLSPLPSPPPTSLPPSLLLPHPSLSTGKLAWGDPETHEQAIDRQNSLRQRPHHAERERTKVSDNCTTGGSCDFWWGSCDPTANDLIVKIITWTGKSHEHETFNSFCGCKIVKNKQKKRLAHILRWEWQLKLFSQQSFSEVTWSVVFVKAGLPPLSVLLSTWNRTRNELYTLLQLWLYTQWDDFRTQF